jgi:hypothetical protein
MAANALDGNPIEGVSMVRMGDGLIRLSWAWPRKRRRGHGVDGKHAAGTEMLTIAIGDRRPPSTLDNAQQIVTVFRRADDDVGRIEMTYGGDRMSAALFAGHQIGGQPVHARQPVLVVEPKRKLAYRFRAATFREREDWLMIRSKYSWQTPALRIVHVQSRRIVAVVKRLALQADREYAVNLSQLRAASRDSSRLLRTFQRLLGSGSLSYELEFEDPLDRDWMDIVHPSAPGDRQLSFLWLEDGRAPAFQ